MIDPNSNPPHSAIEREVARLIAADRVKRAQDFMRDFSIGAFDKALAFNALIMSAGYVGEFSLWDRVKSDLTIPERMFIAVLLTTSLTLFIGWTIKAMWMLSQQQLRLANLVSSIDANDPEAIRAVAEQFRIDSARTRAFAQRWLPFVMGSAVASGGLAALVMVVVCLSHLAAGH